MKIDPEESNTKAQINILDCRAGRPVAQGFAECLRSGPNTCKYALPFGYCFLCGHPRLEEILEHTTKVEQGEKSLQNH